MKRFKKFAGQTDFQIWVFLVCLILFNWPLLTIIPLDRQGLLFFYLFLASGLFVILLFIASRAADQDEDGSDV